MRYIYTLILICGVFILGINVSGLFQNMRNHDLYSESLLRFGKDDIQITYPEIKKRISRKQNESDYEYALRMNHLVSKGLAHIIWNEIENPDTYYQRIPVWENYILYALSFSPWFDDFKRYHFRDYNKTLERGIGICGDAAMVLSGILEDNGIKTKIVSFSRGHVINEVYVNEQGATWHVFDPDFGVLLPFSIQKLISTPSLIRPYYEKAGYADNEIDYLIHIYSGPFVTFKNVEAFGPTTFLVEKWSYYIKWFFPAVLIIISIWGYVDWKKNNAIDYPMKKKEDDE